MKNSNNSKFHKLLKNPTLGWIFGVSGKLKYGMFLLVLLNSTISISTVIFALVLREVVDGAVVGDRGYFLRYTVLLVIIIAGQIAVRAVIRYLDEYVRADMENRLKCRIYEDILSRKYDRITGFHTGELLNRMTNDAVVVADGFAQIIPGIIAMFIKLVSAATVLFVLDYRFSVIFFVGGTVLLVCTALFRRTMKRLHKNVQTADGELRSYLQENLGSLMVLKTFGAEDKSLKASKEYMASHRQARMKRIGFSNLCNIGFAIVMNGGYIFGLVWCGLGVLAGNITYGTLSAVLQLVDQLQSPLANMTGYLPKFYGMISSAERLMELEELEEEDSGVRYDRAFCRTFYEKLESIACEKVTFGYKDSSVLYNADITVHKGEIVAVMGNSGVGKSTLLKLLLAMYMPEDGRIYFKSEGKCFPVTEMYRGMFAYVPQGNFLMSGTIKDAIVFLDDSEDIGGNKDIDRNRDINKNRDIDMSRVRAAAHIACADTFIEKLDNGYDTLIGERGMGLSEGQAQRLAIARALYVDAPILLLDEATSALDEVTEREVLKNIKELTDKTVIIVSHRKAVLDVCDRCVVLEDKHFE